MKNKLYVGNLPFSADDSSIKELFSKSGTVTSASVIHDKETGRSKGFGFIEMSSEQEAATAIENLNGKELEGRALKVNLAKPKEERSTQSRW